MITDVADEMLSVLQSFRVLFAQERTWHHALVLVVGAILCKGKRTVSRVLQVMGKSDEKHYINYHRVLSRVGWSGLKAAQILLGLIVALLAANNGVVVGVDDTLERRWGKKIPGLGIYRDPVRSTAKHKVKSSGLRWVVMQVLVPVPWSNRPWALPCLTVLAPSESANIKQGRRHKTQLDIAAQMVTVVSRWLRRAWICVGDGSFGNVKFGWACRRHGVSLVSRLHWRANLHGFAPVHDPKKRGRKLTKGERLPNPEQLLAQDAPQKWQTCSLRWYSGQIVTRRLRSGTCLWYADGYPPLPIRWVLVVDPDGKQPPAALFSTNLVLSPIDIVETFVWRWSLEVTFEEVRAHLGFQTQRHWSPQATVRTTPALLSLFSICCLVALRLHPNGPFFPRSTAWYHKTHLSFCDVLDSIRFGLWQSRFYAGSALFPLPIQLFKPQSQELNQVIQLLASSL